MTSQAPTKQHHWILPTAVADQRVCWWQDRLFVAVWLFASAVFVALCLRVPAGLPYDEPAHFGNVMFIQNEHRLAEVGEPGSTYQSQMPPLYYTVVAIATAPFTEADAGQMLSIMRLLGLPLVLVLGLLG